MKSKISTSLVLPEAGFCKRGIAALSCTECAQSMSGAWCHDNLARVVTFLESSAKNFRSESSKLSLQPGLQNLEEASGVLVKMAHDLMGWTERETHKYSDY